MKDYIAVVGSLNYDIIVKQNRLPEKGETYTADQVTYTGGGKGANQAVQCAKLGVKTYLIGKVGEDNFGEILLDKLNTFGVDTTYVARSSENTGVGLVNTLYDGSVHATIVPGANFDMKISEIDILSDVLAQSNMIILQMEIPMEVIEHVIRKASEYGVFIVLNAAPAKAIELEVLKLVDCLVVNETEASFYCGARIDDLKSAQNNAKALHDLAKETVIVTLGEKGSLLCNSSGYTHIPAVRAEKVEETTGAGDSFIGAFSYGKYNGMSDLESCKFASKVASYTVMKVGAQEAMPYKHEVI